jgi:thymidylate synthase (FAD)
MNAIPSPLNRPHNPDLDNSLGLPIAVLDHGFVRVIDYMGDDAAIVQAARVSYGGGTKTKSDDTGLIRYLLRHDHTTPFEMCEIKLHVKMPIFVARQWVRHRTASINEVSGRYSVLPGEFYVPLPSDVMAQSTTNKQGRDGAVSEETVADFRKRVAKILSGNMTAYATSVEEGIARELARIVFPLAGYTEFYWKIDLHNLMRFMRLRSDSHAQMEIRAYSKVLETIVKMWCPIAYSAWQDYQKDSVRFSSREVAALRHVARLSATGAVGAGDLAGYGLTSREIEEFCSKVCGDDDAAT